MDQKMAHKIILLNFQALLTFFELQFCSHQITSFMVPVLKNDSGKHHALLSFEILFDIFSNYTHLLSVLLDHKILYLNIFNLNLNNLPEISHNSIKFGPNK